MTTLLVAAKLALASKMAYFMVQQSTGSFCNGNKHYNFDKSETHPSPLNFSEKWFLVLKYMVNLNIILS